MGSIQITPYLYAGLIHCIHIAQIGRARINVEHGAAADADPLGFRDHCLLNPSGSAKGAHAGLLPMTADVVRGSKPKGRGWLACLQ